MKNIETRAEVIEKITRNGESGLTNMIIRIIGGNFDNPYELPEEEFMALDRCWRKIESVTGCMQLRRRVPKEWREELKRYENEARVLLGAQIDVLLESYAAKPLGVFE